MHYRNTDAALLDAKHWSESALRANYLHNIHRLASHLLSCERRTPLEETPGHKGQESWSESAAAALHQSNLCSPGPGVRPIPTIRSYRVIALVCSWRDICAGAVLVSKTHMI